MLMVTWLLLVDAMLKSQQSNTDTCMFKRFANIILVQNNVIHKIRKFIAVYQKILYHAQKTSKKKHPSTELVHQNHCNNRP